MKLIVTQQFNTNYPQSQLSWEDVSVEQLPLEKTAYNNSCDMMERIRNYNADNFIVMSPYAASWLIEHKQDFEQLPSVYCLSAKQAARLKAEGFDTSYPEESSIKNLGRLIHRTYRKGRILFLKGNRSLRDLPDYLRKKGIQLLGEEVYRSFLYPQKSKEHNVDGVLFFSPAEVDSFVSAGNSVDKNTTLFAVGETTGQVLKTYFANPVVVSPIKELKGYMQFAINHLKGAGLR